MDLAFAFPSFPNPLTPVIGLLTQVLHGLHALIPSYGWSLIALAFIIRLAFWPLASAQFKSTSEMQRVAPLVKQLQARHKGNPQALQQETMALYKEHGVNPLAGCLPLLLQLPILFSIYGVITGQVGTFATATWAWIGTGFAYWVNAQWLQAMIAFGHWQVPKAAPQLLALDLTQPDYLLLALYIVSMYLSVRFGSPPSTDPQQAQTQKIMAIMSPVMIAWVGRGWPSAMLLYWFFANLFTMAQTFYFFRKFKIGWFADKNAPPLQLPPKAKSVTPAKTGERKLVANGTVNKSARDGGSKRRTRR